MALLVLRFWRCWSFSLFLFRLALDMPGGVPFAHFLSVGLAMVLASARSRLATCWSLVTGHKSLFSSWGGSPPENADSTGETDPLVRAELVNGGRVGGNFVGCHEENCAGKEITNPIDRKPNTDFLTRPVIRRFTRENVLGILRQWPQAVSADEGDLRVLHDMANAGAQLWRNGLPWPDYLWLDFDDLPQQAITEKRKEVYCVENPLRKTEATVLAVDCLSTGKSELPASGQFTLTSRVIAIVEVKVIEANVGAKLGRFKGERPWGDFLRRKLDQRFGKSLLDADKQIAGGKRLLPFPDARGVAFIINEGARDLHNRVVIGYLAHAIQSCPNLHAIVYMADHQSGYTFARIVRRDDDSVTNRFLTQALMMVSAFSYDSRDPY